jgi:hypothetical protein
MLQFLVVDVVAKSNLDVKTSPDQYLLNIYRFPHLPIAGVRTQEAGSTAEHSILSNGRGSTTLVTLSLRR